MSADLTTAEGRTAFAELYQSCLLDDVMPFWLQHGMDAKQGGIMTCLDRDGSLIDTDKSVWFQGRAGWMFATLHQTLEKRAEWLEASRSCVQFIRDHCFAPSGKMYFTVTREGLPLRMRRYAFSESFAAIAFASYAEASGEARAAEDAMRCFASYLHYSFTPGAVPAKFEPTRPTQGIGAHMIAIVTAQELRNQLGDVTVSGRSCSEWIDESISRIERDFFKPELKVLMETVGPNGEVLDHIDARTLNPGHAIECAWFIMHEGRHRGDQHLIKLGCTILDWMWARGWDEEHGGLFYFRDVFNKPVQEYWHDMKFWWPHCEAIIATLLAWKLTGESRYAQMHRLVHDWSFGHFPDAVHGEWYGYLRLDGNVSQHAKGNMFKGPFHLPRMLLIGSQLLSEELPATGAGP
jgi:N-acylglucosamine 2-epimerase